MWVKFDELNAAARNKLPSGSFAFIDSKGQRHLPIHDANHVRAALGRINQTKDTGTGKLLSPAQKSAALAKIRLAARKHGVDTTQATEQWDAEIDEDGIQMDDGSGSAPVGGPTLTDVHVLGPMNGQKKPKKNGTLKRLTQGVRAHFATGRVLGSSDFETIYRKSIGGTGGSTRYAAEDQSDDGAEPAEDTDTGGDDDTVQIDVTCCQNRCGQCQGAGCGCCAGCMVMVDDDGDGDDDMNNAQSYTEGDAHFISRDGEGLRLYIPHRFSEGRVAGEWIEYLPAPGKWESPRYGEIELTPQRNQNFVRHFNDAVYQDRIPVDAEHETKLSGALGWVEPGKMRVSATGAVEAYVEWTPRGKEMLAKDAFKFFSPEWYDTWKDPATGNKVPDVAIGGALTTRPFFKPSSLRPIIATEQGILAVQVRRPKQEATVAGEKETTDETASAKALAAAEQRIRDLEAQVKAAPVQATEGDAKRMSELEASNAELRKANEAQGEAVKQAAERLAAIELANTHREMTEVAKAFPGDTATHVAVMLALPDTATGTAEKPGPSLRDQYVTTQKAASEQIKAASQFRSVGVSPAQANGGSSAAEDARKAAEAIVTATGGKTDMAHAMAEAWTPERYAQYIAETGN